MVSAMQTMDEESLPPLSSASTGLSERSLRWTAFAKTDAEVFFVFGISAVTDFVLGVEIPIPADGVPSGSEKHERGRWDGMNADPGCKVHGRKHREPTGDVFFVESEGFTRKPDEWIENRAPSNLLVVEKVVKMARANGVFGEQHRALARIPDGQCPIPDQFSQAVRAPLFIRRGDNGNVRGIDGQGVAQLPDEVSAIVQAAVPGDDGAGRRNMWLLLATRFLRGVECAIENPYAALRIRFIAIGAIGSESGADFLDVVRGRRLAFEIPSSKLDAHIVAFAKNLQPVVC
jgi:hypothetical protein